MNLRKALYCLSSLLQYRAMFCLYPSNVAIRVIPYRTLLQRTTSAAVSYTSFLSGNIVSTYYPVDKRQTSVRMAAFSIVS